VAVLKTRTAADTRVARLRERTDLLVWLALVAIGMALTAIAVATQAKLGTMAAPFLGRYRVDLTAGAMAAPVVAALVLWTSTRRSTARWRWRRLLTMSYLASVAWLLSLAVMQGGDGLTGYLSDRDGYRPQIDEIGSLGGLLGAFTDPGNAYSTAVTGHPPGTAILVWLLHGLPIGEVWIGLLWTALAAVTVPLVLASARSACGPVAARRLAPLLILAPYGIWMAVGPDGITVMICAAALGAATYASHHDSRGWKATGWATVAGLLLATATMFAYIVAWLGLSMVCLYFARRRPWHHLATGLGALLPLAAVQLIGFNWAEGLTLAYRSYLERIEADRSVWWWMVLCFVVLILACGPAIVASSRKLRNTPAWPFLVGGTSAVLFSAAMGIARGGVEETWLPFFPWLVIAATAPARPAGTPLPTPLLLAGAGAVAAIAMQSVLVSPW
jgi:hypothetical protein